MRYSVVVPIYNDGYLAEQMCLAVADVFRDLCGEFELIFVDDGSTDKSLDTLVTLANRFRFVKLIELSRNFGQHIALACGFREAKGDIVIRMNVDMQDPPSELPKLLTTIQNEDVDMVIGKYRQRKSPWKDKATSGIFFIVFRLLTGFNVPTNTSPMRVMNRRFIDAYNRLTERSRFPQGLDFWLGFRKQYVEIEHRARADKKSSYTLGKRLLLAYDGILYFSDRPLKALTIIGFTSACIGFGIGGMLIMAKLLGARFLPGYTSLVAIGLTTFGIQLTSMGVIGLYIGKIFKEVQNRPLYIIRKVYGEQ